MFKAGKSGLDLVAFLGLGVSGSLTDGQGSIARTLCLMYYSSHSLIQEAAGVMHTLGTLRYVSKVRAVV